MISTEHAHLAARFHRARRLRDEVFAEQRDGFGEPGWDLLLVLSGQDGHECGMTEPELFAAAGAANEVTKRYLDWLVSTDLVTRSEATPETFALSERGRRLMTDYMRSAFPA